MKKTSHQYSRKVLGMCMVLAISTTLTFTLNSCEEKENYGTPKITSVRTTDPATATAPITSGNLGQLVVIQGENLESTQEVYFNSEKAFVNPSFVTNNNVIVRVPDDFPTEITNNIKLITKGGEAIYNFPIDIPPPVAIDFPLEWVPSGGTLIINGNYFHNVKQIEFAGGVTTTNFTVPNARVINVIVPPDASSGPVKVHAVAGIATSKAHFRDNRGMMVNFDDFPICWGGNEFVVNASNVPANIPAKPISGNYYYIKKNYAANTWWIQETVIAYCGNVSVAGNKANFAVAFEMWVGNTWDKNWFEIEMVGSSTIFYEWRGWEHLGGEAKKLANTGWITVKIPLSMMTALRGETFKVGRLGSFKAQHETTIEFAFDNIRLVPLN